MKPVFEDFSGPAQEIAQQLYILAQSRKHWLITTEHIFLALLESSDERLKEIFSRLEVRKTDAAFVLWDIANALQDAGKADEPHITPGVKATIDEAYIESRRLGAKAVEGEHILLGLARVYHRPDIKNSAQAVLLVDAMGLTPERIRQVLWDIELGLKVQKQP